VIAIAGTYPEAIELRVIATVENFGMGEECINA